MGRIPPDRIGYSGYACAGISQYVVATQDCLGPNCYKQLPPLIKGPISDFPWLDMSPIDDDIRLKAIVASCNVSFDPFYGTEVDLRQALVDHGFSSLMPADCYESDGRYATGFTNPHPFFPNCGCGTYVPGGGPPPAVSSSSSSSESYPAEGTCGITWYWSCDMETGWQEQGPYAKFCYDYLRSDWICCDYGTCSGDPHPEGWDCVEYSMVYYTKLGTTCNEYDCTSNCSMLWAEDPPEEPTEEICPCVPPETGACCVGVDCYEGLTEEECITGGGEWQGPETDCGPPNPCIEPIPCTCVIGQIWVCDPEPCAGWQYASDFLYGCWDYGSGTLICGDLQGHTPEVQCCWVIGGASTDLTCYEDCADLWSQPPPGPPEEECPPCGACCLPGGGCEYVPAATCSTHGGEWLGEGVPCDACPAGASACCFDGGWCDDSLSEAQCYEYGGIAYYPGEPCAGGGGDECPH